MNSVDIYKNEDGFRIVDKDALDYFKSMQEMEEHYVSVLRFIRRTIAQNYFYEEK